MYKTIEAVYRDGAVFPLKEEMPARYARILITILSENDSGKNSGLIPGSEKGWAVFISLEDDAGEGCLKDASEYHDQYLYGK
jgi:hypothetical protein